MRYFVAVLVLCADIGAAINHPVCPKNTGCEFDDCTHVEKGTECFYTLTESRTLYIIYRPKEKYFLKCQNDNKTPISVDNSELPAWTTQVEVEVVEINNCLAPLKTSYYDTLKVWNVTVTKSLLLSNQHANPKLEEYHLRGLPIQELIIHGKDYKDPPRPSENYLDGIMGLRSLELLRVVPDSQALMRLPITLENLTLNYTRVPDAVSKLGKGSAWLEKLHSLKYLYLKEGSKDVAAPLTIPEFNRRKLTTLSLNNILLNSSSLGGKFKNSSIEDLELFSCGLNNLPDKLFEGANKLRKLVINYHSLIIPRGTFSPLQWLTELDLRNNNLDRSALVDAVSSLPRLQNLTASDNPLGSLCDNSDLISTKVKWPKSLLRLELMKTNATRICPEWIENEELELIDLRDNDIGDVTFNDFKMRRAVFGQTVTLDLSNNPKLRIVNVSKDDILQCHNDLSSLKDSDNRTRAKVKLNIKMSDVRCDNGAYWLREALRNCRSWLKSDVSYYDTGELLCPYNGHCLPECSCQNRPRDNATVAKCLGAGALPLSPQWPQAEKEFPLALHVPSKQLTVVPNVMLVELHAPNNNISRLDVSDIADTLLILDVRNNCIKHISEEVALKLSAKGTNHSVLLKGNWLDCTCSDTPAYTLLSSNNVVLDWNETLCADNIHVLEKIKSGLCFPVFYTVLILTCLGLLLVMLGLLLHNFKLQIRQVLFQLNCCRRYISRVNDDTEKEKDVFLSYYHEDLAQINIIKNALEGRGYSTIEHNRDFEPGDPILSQIEDSVQKARRTLVLVSNNFIQSKWMPHEFRCAHAYALKYQTSKVVIIRHNLSQETTGMLPPDLRFYIKHHTYLDLLDENFWEKLYEVLGTPIFQVGCHNGQIDFHV